MVLCYDVIVVALWFCWVAIGVVGLFGFVVSGVGAGRCGLCTSWCWLIEFAFWECCFGLIAGGLIVWGCWFWVGCFCVL